MGAYASSFHKSGGQILLDSTDPSQANWITAHAEACKLSVPEVLRCWENFQIFEPDSNGNVEIQRLKGNNFFSKQLLKQLPYRNDGLLTFQTYCSAVSWLSNSTTEVKLQGLYRILTSSSLSREMLENILQILYPHESLEETQQLCNLIMQEIDTKKQGYIDEDQFMTWMNKLRWGTLKNVLHFPVIPHEVAEENELKTPQQVTAVIQDHRKITDQQLYKIATEIARNRRDWRLLANHLGFLEKDSKQFENKHAELQPQILEMLQVWRNKSGNQDLRRILQAALKDSGNADIYNNVFQLNF
ncbi:uncharacterized protein LOC120532151 [Polypterus senegalus]|uniref:uncharacterized protein LOC120532151 n=1 Tax=Polypterus senegalus TaxID=55291 RepID=UPI0019650BCB|nr:uncharacterized protein LOC120532151 [Polypterus senegalus]